MKFIRNLIILGLILSVIFFAVAISGSGDKFRWLGRQIGGVASIAGDKLANEAEAIRKKALQYKDKISGLTDIEKRQEKAK
ncbi:MAG: hypothetical protein N3A59_07605 [Thermodesulfovibrionales bacterium]|nr:hypothetical protein [Thermodesulfovibrionales bacterium]